MTFKVKKIRKTKRIQYKRIAKKAVKRYAKKVKTQFTFKNIIVIVSALIVIVFSIGALKIFTFIQNLSMKDLLLALINKPVQTDEQNHTNILLLGYGGGTHDGANLMDTILIVSLDLNKQIIGMLSIPRDLWINTAEVPGSRINNIVELELDKNGTVDQGIKVLEKTIEDVFDIPIHYYAAIDFQGFEDIINNIGGIEMDIPETLYDPFYPKGETYDFDPFYIKEGLQTLDGATALKYARSRKTTSDFNRAIRQQKVIQAIKTKLTSSKVLLSKSKLTDLYSSYQKNVNTDLELYEFIYLGRKAKDFNTDNIVHSVLSDDPYVKGGILYTPERRFYGGAFVLIPETNTNEELQTFANLTLYKPQVALEKATIHMLNGTRTENLAFNTLNFIERYGFDIIRYGGDENKEVQTTKIYYRTTDETENKIETQKELESIFNTKAQTAENTKYSKEYFTTEADFIIVLGQDFADFKQNHKKLFY